MDGVHLWGKGGCVVRISQGTLLGVDILRQMLSGRGCCLRFESCINGRAHVYVIEVSGYSGFLLRLKFPFVIFAWILCGCSLRFQNLLRRAPIRNFSSRQNSFKMSDEKAENTKKSDMLMVSFLGYNTDEEGLITAPV